MIFENYLADFYDFHRRFLICATITRIIDCNDFDIQFIIYLLSKLKKQNYKL